MDYTKQSSIVQCAVHVRIVYSGMIWGSQQSGTRGTVRGLTCGFHPSIELECAMLTDKFTASYIRNPKHQGKAQILKDPSPLMSNPTEPSNDKQVI
jgi:hypothetical protein